MIALLEWVLPERGKRRKAAAVKEEIVLHLRLYRMGVLRGPRTPETVLRRRVLAAGKRLRKMGVTQAVLPEGFPYGRELARCGARPVSTLPLRRALAADWVRWVLEKQGKGTAGARVAVCAAQLTGEVVRTVTELCLRHRYVLLDLPYGGEELCRQLRREYGVSLLLGPSKEQLEGAEALVLFDPRTDLVRKDPAVLTLYDETQALPPISLPPAAEEALPQGADRGQLLAALREAGVLRPGQVTVAGARA